MTYTRVYTGNITQTETMSFYNFMCNHYAERSPIFLQLEQEESVTFTAGILKDFPDNAPKHT